MYKSGGKAIRARNGQVVQAAPFQSWKPSGSVARVEPNRRWFGNTRVIGQKELAGFREAMGGLKQDPYQFVLKQNKLPMSLLTDPVSSAHSNLLSSESFDDTFGKKSKRRRPNLKSFSTMEEMVKNAEDKEGTYDETKDRDLVDKNGDDIRDWSGFGTSIFTKGQSKRIWGELYKVIDASDIVVQVSGWNIRVSLLCVGCTSGLVGRSLSVPLCLYAPPPPRQQRNNKKRHCPLHLLLLLLL